MSEKKSKAQLAMEYAGRGWYVFPIVGGHKDRPLVKWGSEASCDPVTVSQWWRQHPSANIGLAVMKSGLAVVDLDNKGGKDGDLRWDELEMEHGVSPGTATTRTPSGGRHLIFRGVCGNTQSKLADGIDTRGSGGMGGYVLLPGSTLEAGTEYSWISDVAPAELPKWIADAVGKRSDERRHVDDNVIELDQPKSIRWAREFLENDAIPAVEFHGGNNRTFRVACTLRDRGISELLAGDLMVELYNPRCEPPWAEEEVRKFAENAYAYASVVPPGGDSAEAHFGRPGEDDFGAAGPPPFPPGASEETEQDAADAPAYRGLMDEWVWVAQQQIFMRRSDKLMLSAASFDGKFGHIAEKGTPSKNIFQSAHMMRKPMSIEFLPGLDEFPDADVNDARRYGERYNTWSRPPITPKKGDVSTFLAHMAHLLPNEKERAEAIRWLAWVLQYQTKKPNFMLLIQGRQGCGKSWVGVLLQMLVGEKNTTQLRTEDVGNRFNSWVLRTRLAVIEELMGDEKRTLANRMKAMVTQDMVSVELKGKDLLTMPNRCAFLSFTNHEDALRLENGDRRYLVFLSPAPGGRDTDPAYFQRLWSFLEGDGPAAVMWHLLMEVEVSEQWGLGAAPITRAHESMRREGLPEVERFLIEAFEDRQRPFDQDLVATQDVEAALPDRLKRGFGLTKAIPMFLRTELGAELLGPHRLADGVSCRRLWAIRRHEHWRAMEPADRAKAYMDSSTMESGRSRSDDFPDDFPDDDPLGDGLGDPLA